MNTKTKVKSQKDSMGLMISYCSMTNIPNNLVSFTNEWELIGNKFISWEINTSEALF